MQRYQSVLEKIERYESPFLEGNISKIRLLERDIENFIKWFNKFWKSRFCNILDIIQDKKYAIISISVDHLTITHIANTLLSDTKILAEVL